MQSWSLTWSSPRPGRTRSSGGGAASSATEATACSGLSLTAWQVNIKQQRSSSFVDMCLAPCLPGQPAGSNGVYALTDSGSLLLLRSTGRTVDRSINLQVGCALQEVQVVNLQLLHRALTPLVACCRVGRVYRCRRPLHCRPHPSRWRAPAHREWCGCLPASRCSSGPTCPTGVLQVCNLVSPARVCVWLQCPITV